MISEQMTGKFPFRLVLPHIRILRNRLTRTVAALLAVAMIGGLGFLIDRQTGNPISLRLAQHAVVQHFETHHEGEGYVVGPMRFLGRRTEGHSARYYCKVYKTGSVDTGFSAFVENGTVYTTEECETLSGSNTYNRFINELSAAFFTEDTESALREAGMGDYGKLVDFLSFGEDVFDAENPVFVPDSEFRLNDLPLPTAVCVEFQTDDISDEALAERLTLLYELAQKRGVPFDYYSAVVRDGTSYAMNPVYDVPADVVKDADALAQYLADEPRISMEQAQANAAWNGKLNNFYSDDAWKPCD